MPRRAALPARTAKRHPKTAYGIRLGAVLDWGNQEPLLVLAGFTMGQKVIRRHRTLGRGPSVARGNAKLLGVPAAAQRSGCGGEKEVPVRVLALVLAPKRTPRAANRRTRGPRNRIPYVEPGDKWQLRRAEQMRGASRQERPDRQHVARHRQEFGGAELPGRSGNLYQKNRVSFPLFFGGTKKRGRRRHDQPPSCSRLPLPR